MKTGAGLPAPFSRGTAVNPHPLYTLSPGEQPVVWALRRACKKAAQRQCCGSCNQTQSAQTGVRSAGRTCSNDSDSNSLSEMPVTAASVADFTTELRLDMAAEAKAGSRAL